MTIIRHKPDPNNKPELTAEQEQKLDALRLPSSLMQQLKTTIKSENTSINQFICLAVAEKLTALETENILEKRAKNYSQEKFLKALEGTGNNPPREGDGLPEQNP